MRALSLLGTAALFLLRPPHARAIEIADGFTYANTTGFAASRALATDFTNYPMFEAVGVMYMHSGQGTSTGSGTLLNNEWVLTAAHNWNNSITSMEFVVAGQKYSADMSERFQHPLWDGAVGPSQGWDIALFKLTAPVTANITFPELYTKSDEMGKRGIILGAGDLGTGTTPWASQPGDPNPLLVYAAANVVDRLTTQTNSGYTGGLMANDFDGETLPAQNTLGISYHNNGDAWLWDSGSAIVTTLIPAGTITGNDSADEQFTLGGDILEGSVAPGDSGGPTFLEDGGEWKLAGITSWGHNPWDELSNGGDGFRGLYGDVNYMTRVSQNADWIASVIPEPSSFALLVAFGAGALLFIRRKGIPC